MRRTGIAQERHYWRSSCSFKNVDPLLHPNLHSLCTRMDHGPLTFELLLNSWFVSTSTNSMKCFVNWIPLNTHVCFKKPQPWGFVKHAATNVWGAKGKTRPFREILVHRKGRGKAKGGYMKKRRNESPANYKSWIYFVSKNIMRWNLYLHRFAQASYIYTCSTQVTAPGLSP